MSLKLSFSLLSACVSTISTELPIVLQSFTLFSFTSILALQFPTYYYILNITHSFLIVNVEKLLN